MTDSSSRQVASILNVWQVLSSFIFTMVMAIVRRIFVESS